MFALMAVQRQIAASRLARPWMRLQHGFFGGEPTTTLTNPSKSAHTPNFRVSLGQVALGLGLGVGLGFGFGFGLGLGLGVGQVPHAVTRAKKRRLSERKKVSDAELLEPILLKP